MMHIEIHVKESRIQGERFTLHLCMPYSTFLFASLTSHAPAREAMPKLIESPGLDRFIIGLF